ncbi:MAG TPA: hypothetical protein VNA29_03035 [Sphingomicrobium sp.]|nr:hypothetical protein [Sphingomicrobium sp.]
MSHRRYAGKVRVGARDIDGHRLVAALLDLAATVAPRDQQQGETGYGTRAAHA